MIEIKLNSKSIYFYFFYNRKKRSEAKKKLEEIEKTIMKKNEDLYQIPYNQVKSLDFYEKYCEYWAYEFKNKLKSNKKFKASLEYMHELTNYYCKNFCNQLKYYILVTFVSTELDKTPKFLVLKSDHGITAWRGNDEEILTECFMLICINEKLIGNFVDLKDTLFHELTHAKLYITKRDKNFEKYDGHTLLFCMELREIARKISTEDNQFVFTNAGPYRNGFKGELSISSTTEVSEIKNFLVRFNKQK